MKKPASKRYDNTADNTEREALGQQQGEDCSGPYSGLLLRSPELHDGQTAAAPPREDAVEEQSGPVEETQLQPRTEPFQMEQLKPSFQKQFDEILLRLEEQKQINRQLRASNQRMDFKLSRLQVAQRRAEGQEWRLGQLERFVYTRSFVSRTMDAAASSPSAMAPAVE
eukprot:TRINITY_DN6864_c0_g1_i2.p1 TRINITY_DN6864_c0_g1~~TRINITY_DN6864_c0_g1_i2.p1  ORF type:complete len:168 (+),score=35.75 TRINITY_DN6864_c0_g1_i2:83-586(+)